MALPFIFISSFGDRDEQLLALTVRNVCCLKGATERGREAGQGGAGAWASFIGSPGAEQSRAGGEERKGRWLLTAGSLAHTGVRLAPGVPAAAGAR